MTSVTFEESLDIMKHLWFLDTQNNNSTKKSRQFKIILSGRKRRSVDIKFVSQY